MPLTVGGGIHNVDDMQNLLKAGADKTAVNSAAVSDPDLITQGAEKFGAQCVVLAIDAKWNPVRQGYDVTLTAAASKLIWMRSSGPKKASGAVRVNS